MMDTKTMILLLVMALLCVMLGTLIGILLICLRKHQDQGPYDGGENSIGSPAHNMKCWYIELWDIEQGTRYATTFCGGVTLGRGIPEYSSRSCMFIGVDNTISREQCLIYQQDGLLYLWNLSKVNPTRVNGLVPNQPVPIRAGDRLAIGKHTFLLTNLLQG